MFKYPKTRFHNSGFQRQLKRARGYKRVQRKIPEGTFGIFFSKIGLGRIITRLIVLAVLGFLFYLVYAPNFLTIKNINIIGVLEADKQELLRITNNFLNSKRLFPQKNNLLLSKTELSAYLSHNSAKVISAEVQKKFPNSLDIYIEPRLDRLVLLTPSTYYVVSSDGIITAKLPGLGNGTSTENLPNLKVLKDDNLALGQKVSSKEVISFFYSAHSFLTKYPNLMPAYFVSSEVSSLDSDVLLKNGLKIMLNTSVDIGDVLARMELLLVNSSAGELANLYYVDLRFENKGYLCYKGSPCVAGFELTSRPSTTINTLPE